jgi:hypothetical protein
MLEERPRQTYDLNMTERHALRVLPFLVLGFMGVLECLFPLFFLHDDNASAFLPFYTHNWRTAAETGELPVINLHQHLGQNFLGQGQTGVLYPPTYAAAAFSNWILGDTRAAIDILAFLHLPLAAFVAAHLARLLGASPAAAFGTGLLWATNPFVLCLARCWIVASYAALYLPLILLLTERWMQNPALPRGLILVGVKVMAFFQGHAEYFFYIICFDGLYFFLRFFRLCHDRRRPWKQAFTCYVLPHLALPLLAAPLLLPMAEAASLSEQRDKKLSLFVRLAYSTEPLSVVQAQLLVFKEAVFHIDSRIYFLGPAFLLPFLFLFPARFFKEWRLDQRIKLCALLGSLALVLACGFYLFVPWLLIGWIPPLDRFRWPFKLFFFAAFFLPLGTCLLVSHWQEKHPDSTRRIFAGFLGLALLQVFVAARPGPASCLDLNTLESPAPFFYPRYQESLQRVMAYLLPPERIRSAAALTDNYATYFDVHHLEGYDPLISKKAIQVIHRMGGEHRWKPPLTQANIDHLASWAVRYIVTENSEERHASLSRFAGLKWLENRENLSLYEIEGAARLVECTPAPSRVAVKGNQIQVEWDEPLASPVEIRFQLLKTLPLLCISQQPGRSAQPVEVREENLHLAATVPSQTTLLTLSYHNFSFARGCQLALLGLGALALGAVLAHRTGIPRQS